MPITKKLSKINKTIRPAKRPRQMTKPPRLGEAVYWVGTHPKQKPSRTKAKRKLRR